MGSVLMPVPKVTLRRDNLNYRSKAVAKGLLRTVFCSKLLLKYFVLLSGQNVQGKAPKLTK